MSQEIMKEDFTSKELKKYSLPDAKIAEFKKKYLVLKVTSPDDKENYEMCKVAHREMKDIRLNIEDKRKELKASSWEFGKKVDGEAKRLTAEIGAVESHLLTQRKVVEDEKKRIEEERKEKERLEEERKRKEEEDRLNKIRLAQEAKEEELRKKEEAIEREQEKQQEKIRQEQEKNRKEKEKIEVEKQRIIDIEQAKERAIKQAKEEAGLEAERKKQEALDKQKAESDALAKKKQEEADALIKKKQRETEKMQMIAAKKAAAERKEKERLEEILKNQITCPKCGHKFQRKNKK